MCILVEENHNADPAQLNGKHIGEDTNTAAISWSTPCCVCCTVVSWKCGRSLIALLQVTDEMQCWVEKSVSVNVSS